MNEFECLSTELNEKIALSETYKIKSHMDESAILQYVDSLMAGELNSDQKYGHWEECGFCKKKVSKYLNYYGFNELKWR